MDMSMGVGLWFLVSVIPAIIAYKKERNFFLWWFFSILLFPIALVFAIILGPPKRCFYCDEPMRKNALICSACGRDAITDAEIDALAAEPLDAP